MSQNISGTHDGYRSDREARSEAATRPVQYGRSQEDIFLNGAGRFKRRSDVQNSVSNDGSRYVAEGLKVSGSDAERRAGSDRRAGRDRRCGIDTRSEVDRFLQGERRSGVERRSGRDRRLRSFKKARAFVRDLGLKSEGEWYDYVNSGMKPRDIPSEPQKAYAIDGWAGWSDWLGAGAVSQQLSRILRTLKG